MVRCALQLASVAQLDGPGRRLLWLTAHYDLPRTDRREYHIAGLDQLDWNIAGLGRYHGSRYEAVDVLDVVLVVYQVR